MSELLPGGWVLVRHVQELIHKWTELPMPLKWAGAGLIFLFVEFHFRHLIAVWFVPASFAAALFAVLAPGVELLQIAGFVLVLGVSFSYRPDILRRVAGHQDNHPPPPGRVIGKQGTCIERLDSGGGLVSVDGHRWSAVEPVGRPIDCGERVHVIGRKDLTLLVEPVSPEASVNPMVGRLHGRRARWLDAADGGIMLGGRRWPAVPWPPSTRIRAGQPVSVVAVGSRSVFVEPVHDATKAPGDMIGRAGRCVDPINGGQAGAVHIDGVVWRARAEGETSILAGRPVQVVDMDGAVVIVADAKNGDNPLFS